MDKNKLLLIFDDGSTQAFEFRTLARSLGFGPAVISQDLDDLRGKLERRAADFFVIFAKQRELIGGACINLIRNTQDFAFCPVLLVNYPDSVEETMLAKEFPLTTVLERPVSAVQFKTTIHLLRKEVEWYTANRERFAVMLSDAVKNGPAMLFSTLVASAPRNGVGLSFVVADEAVAQNQLKVAEEAFRWILEHESENVRAAAGLGRVLFLAGRHAEAAPYLRIARRMVRVNCERLCMLGEIALAEGSSGQAKRSFQEALQVLPKDDRALTGLSVAERLPAMIKKSAEGQLSLSLVQMYNMVAIAHVRENELQRAAEVYSVALKLSSSNVLRARLCFNLGLCFLKWRKESEAKAWFKQSAEIGGQEFQRAVNYLAKPAEAQASPQAPKAGQPSRQSKLDIDLDKVDLDDLTDLESEMLAGIEEEKIGA